MGVEMKEWFIAIYGRQAWVDFVQSRKCPKCGEPGMVIDSNRKHVDFDFYRCVDVDCNCAVSINVNQMKNPMDMVVPDFPARGSWETELTGKTNMEMLRELNESQLSVFLQMVFMSGYNTLDAEVKFDLSNGRNDDDEFLNHLMQNPFRGDWLHRQAEMVDPLAYRFETADGSKILRCDPYTLYTCTHRYFEQYKIAVPDLVFDNDDDDYGYGNDDC